MRTAITLLLVGALGLAVGCGSGSTGPTTKGGGPPGPATQPTSRPTGH